MTTQTTRTHRTRARRLGALAVAFSALLSPAGKIVVGAVAAAALIGGVATRHHTPSPTLAHAPQPAVHSSFRLAQTTPSATLHTPIESDGETMPIMLAEGAPANSGSGVPTTTPGLTFSSPPDGDPSGPGAQSPRFGTPQGGLPLQRPTPNIYPPGFSRPAGHAPSPTSTPQGTPPGAAPSGGSAGPQNSGPANTPPTASPAGQTPLAGPNTPAGKDAPAGEAGAPAAPQGTPQTEPVLDEKPAPPNTPDSMRQPGSGDPFNPLFPTSAMGPLHTTDQPLPQIRPLNREAIPEPSMLGLMLIGFAALAWKARQRLAPVKGAWI